MNKPYKFIFTILALYPITNSNLIGQQNNDKDPAAIINKFIEVSGGNLWTTLKSRKEYASVEYEEDKNALIPLNNYHRIKINSTNGESAEVHKDGPAIKSIFVYKPECNWYYSNKTQVVKFFGPEPIKFNTTFPRTELMEVLNLEPMKKVHLEDTLYRVDFKDSRQLDNKQSLFFGVKSGLLYKRNYTSKNEVKWEFIFSNYKELGGIKEPRLIKLTSNGKDYFSIVIESILYNSEIDPTIFTPPVPCKNYDDFTHLEFPYLPNIN